MTTTDPCPVNIGGPHAGRALQRNHAHYRVDLTSDEATFVLAELHAVDEDWPTATSPAHPVAHGLARCHPGDRFDLETGQNLATARALFALAVQIGRTIEVGP